MSHANRYDVTSWPVGDPTDDIGEVLNSIIADIKARQATSGDGGRPGAVIYLPPGDYRLRTQVLIDVSFLRIEGAGHGFTSSSIRFNVPPTEWPDLHELWPGGSRILVDLPANAAGGESAGAAFLVARDGAPRISSVEFVDFCIDGLHFVADGSDLAPENTYVNGKTGIHVATANDSFRVNGMGFVYLEHAVTIHHADALSVHDNFIAECGNGIELRGWGQASKITDNFVGAGFAGHSIYAENHGGLLITANNVFPRGASSVHLEGVTRSSVTNNRLHSFYPGVLILAADSSENLVAGNHVLRDVEPWTPFLGVDNGRDDLFGLLRISGDHNSVIGNHFSEVVDSAAVRPAGTSPVVIRLLSGVGNYVATNHVVALDVRSAPQDSAYAAQVEALLTTAARASLPVTTVQVDASSSANTILDSGTEAEVVADPELNAVRLSPTVGSLA
jgi:inulin fructotransferase (DFA-I-forming)